MPTCFLHIGSHKTGTTAFQWFADENRDVLKRYNILYPETGANRTGSHLPLLKRLFGRPEKLPNPNPSSQIQWMEGSTERAEIPASDQGRKRFERELQSHSDMNLLISAEDLENRIIQSAFSEVVDYFRVHKFDIKVIMYVRNQPQYMNSRYIQKTKVFGLNGSLKEFVAEDISSPIYRYLAFAAEMERLGVTFIARPYNKTVRERGIAWDFLEQAVGSSVDQALFASPRKANVSLGPIAVGAIRTILNRLHEREIVLSHEQRTACKALFHDESKGPRWPEGRSFNGLDTELAHHIEATFAEENDVFARRVFGCSWREAFPEDVGLTYEPNTFDPETATHQDRRLFQEIMGEVWPKVLAIATDQTVILPWDAKLISTTGLS